MLFCLKIHSNGWLGFTEFFCNVESNSLHTNLQVITGAGHHVYADKAETFNRHVIEACKLADSGETKKKFLMQIKSCPTNELEGETSNTESEENISTADGVYSPEQQSPSS